MGNEIMQPRVIRLRDAPAYLGMDKNRFNDEVRPQIPEVPIGGHGVGFDRLDLDWWFDEYKKRNGRAVRSKKKWQESERQDSISEPENGMLTRLSSTDAFVKAQELAASKRRKSI
jgi:hypothetical protein